jgi:flagellar protein FlaG
MNKVVIKILNGESGEVIRQIPAQELVDLAKHLDDSKGLLVREHA